jgi:hypothetical protein
MFETNTFGVMAMTQRARQAGRTGLLPDDALHEQWRIAHGERCVWAASVSSGSRRSGAGEVINVK